MDWKQFLSTIGRDYRKEQEIFYNRTSEFIKSKKHILVNPAGMGLGKTLATCKVIKDSLLAYEFFYIANPTAPLKEVWAKHLNELDMNNYMIWFAKLEMCLKKKESGCFDESKNCNDTDCEYYEKLWANKKPLETCIGLLEKLKLPTTPNKYYLENNQNCLLPICRLGLKTRKILVGDFFGILNSNMFKYVTSLNEIDRNRRKACLIIDEAHLLPGRAKDYLSRSINFDRVIRELNNEIHCDYTNKTNLRLKKPFIDTITSLENVKEKLVKQTTTKDNTIRYTYSDFRADYISLKIGYAFKFEELAIQLELLAKVGHKSDEEDYENEKEPYCRKFLRFLKKWEEKDNDPNYSKYFQYSIKSSNNSIRFFINCQDTSDYLRAVLSLWGKIILNSGTISDLDYFKHHTGLEDLNVQYESHLEAYSIKDKVIIYPFGSFVSNNRLNTYEKNKDLLIKIINNLTGRTIIFVQSKNDSINLELQLKNLGKDIINFCKKDDGFEVSKEEFSQCIDKFNSLKEGIALMNINGRVEGHNFQNIEDNKSVSNIIIYGYPFPKRGIQFEDEKKYLLEKLKDIELTNKWIDYVPTLDKIHQACMRGMRKKEDVPIIILWDVQFGLKELAYNYLPNDLKGEVVWDSTQLINLVKKRDGERKTNI
jgi:hypothetical protein